jgi:hypothetical protein
MVAAEKVIRSGAQVKKIIRDTATQRYLTEAGGWTEEPGHAWLMGSSGEAQDVADLLNLSNVEVRFLFGADGTPTTWDFSIPLNSWKADSRVGKPD